MSRLTKIFFRLPNFIQMQEHVFVMKSLFFLLILGHQHLIKEEDYRMIICLILTIHVMKCVQKIGGMQQILKNMMALVLIRSQDRFCCRLDQVALALVRSNQRPPRCQQKRMKPATIHLLRPAQIPGRILLSRIHLSLVHLLRSQLNLLVWLLLRKLQRTQEHDYSRGYESQRYILMAQLDTIALLHQENHKI
jgi:hypothetical protein